MRILLYTGKGGVGKTSVAAASALASAAHGHRTLVVSTDAAHSLSDSLDITLGPEPKEIRERVWAQEIDVYYQIDKYYGVIQDYLSRVLAWRGLDDVMAREMTAFPGMDELASLLEIVYHFQSGKYETIIIDAAPTGETLKFLSFPDVASWWLEKLFPLQRKAVQLLGPVVQPILNIPLPSDQVFDAVKEGIGRLGEMHAILSNPAVSTIRLVVNPEKMVIKEAQRTYTYLGLYGYTADLVIANRVLPEDATAGYFAGWKGMQAKYLQLIEESFAPLPIRHVPYFNEEVVGFAMLERMAQSLFGSEDPAATFYAGPAQRIEKGNGSYIFRVPLPLLSKDRLDLTRIGDELVVRVGNQRRNFILPHVLATLDIDQARLENGELRVVFNARPADAASKR